MPTGRRDVPTWPAAPAGGAGDPGVTVRGVGHRQWVGLVVIGVAVVLLAAVTGLRTHQVAGAGQAAPVPGPPAVGDCVADPVAGRQSVLITGTAITGGTVPVYPVQQSRPCTGSRYGEVTSVIAAPKPTTVEGEADDRYLNDPNQNSCVLTAAQYVGMTTQPIHRFWQPYLQVNLALSRPSPRQEAAGQHWAACIVTLPPPTMTSAPPQYGGSLRNALTTGAYRDQLGSCLLTTNWDDGFTTGGCRQPHPLEFLADGDSGDHPVTRNQIQQTCRQLAGQLTALPDPTANGALAVVVHIQAMNGATVTTPQIPAHSYLTCGVAATGGRKLRGSLLALGRQPIPWA